MESLQEQMRGRTKQFALRAIRLFRALPRTEEGRILGRQLLRSGTSVAANYRAPGRARSRAEFVAKIDVVVEEADETVFWLELLVETYREAWPNGEAPGGSQRASCHFRSVATHGSKDIGSMKSMSQFPQSPNHPITRSPDCPTLGLSMIVKDAEADLARCLESTQGVVDEIVIGDTGSADSSMEIARRYSARVITVPWENDFSRARNRVLQENRTDWILFMDADEMLDAEAARAIPCLLARQELAGYRVTIWNYVPTLTNRLWDSPAKPNPNRLDAARPYPAYVEHQNIRLFRRHPEIYFEGRVHETTGHRILGTGRQLGEADFVIHHFGLAVDAETRLRKSRFYRELGREKVREKPNDAQAHFELGIEELDTFRDPAAALTCFERVIELTPQSHRAWTFAGIALVRLERFQEGLKRLKRAEQLGGRSVLVFETQGDAYYHAGDFNSARRCYQKAQEYGGGAAIIESKLGVSEVRLGRTSAGLRHMERAIAREPNFGEIYDILIMAAVWLGNPKLAAETAERRLSAVEPTAESFLRAASIRAQLGEWPRVAEILRAGCERFPESPKLRLAWTELQQRTGQNLTAANSA